MDNLPEWAQALIQAALALVAPVFWIAVLAWSVRREPRRLRNGFFLIFAILAIVGLLMDAVGAFDVAQTVAPGVSSAAIAVVVAGAAVLPFALIANGITMVRRESRSLGNLLSLVVGLAILFSPALLTLPFLHYSWWTLGFVALVGLSAATLGYLFLGFVAFTMLYSSVGRRARGNAVIVLGAQVIRGRVPPLLAGRLTAGVAAASRRGAAAPIVVSGGQGADEEVAEGDAMGRWLNEHGVADDRIIVEDRARTTEENLMLSAALLAERGIESPYLIATSNYHAPRAALLARDLGVDAQAVGGPTAWYYLPSAYLREFVAVLAMRRFWVAAAFVPAIAFAVMIAVLAIAR